MTKAISAIIATIMLLMITVALIGVFYVFGSGLMTTSTGSAGGAAAATTDRMLKTIAVSIATCANTTSTNNVINFTVQNVGTKDILSGELTVYVDDALNTQIEEISSGLASNAQQSIGVQTTTYSKTRTLKIQGPSNTEQRSLTC